MIYKNNYKYLGIDFKHYSHSLGRAKCTRIVIPNGAQPKTGWTACYLLHPVGANRFGWLQQLQKYDQFSFLNIAFIFPEAGRRWFINDESGYAYEDYIIKDLIPQIDSEFPSISKNNRIIGGFSMGGASALFIALRYLGVFKTVFSIAGAFHAAWRQGNPYFHFVNQDIMMPSEIEHTRVWGGLNSKTRLTYNLKSILNSLNIEQINCEISKFILEVGYSDYPRMLSMNRKTHLYLIKKGIEHSYSEYPGTHNWVYATQALLRILRQIIS